MDFLAPLAPWRELIVVGLHKQRVAGIPQPPETAQPCPAYQPLTFCL